MTPQTTPRPRFCPGCGARLPDGAHGAQPFSHDDKASDDEARWSWNCYCDACHWSGDISPESEENNEPAN